MYATFLKPVLDRFAAAILLMLSVPILMPVMALLAATNGAHVWFRQPRPGYRHKIFFILKFKTMTDETDMTGSLKPDDERLTTLGKFIRKTSLDELPQLINVLKGEMSFIGPRPLLEEYLPLYSSRQDRRHEVRPGITGWAQVNGRNAISWEERFNLDVWYVDHISFLLDLKILLMTVVKVLKLEGISSRTSATMERFRGNQ